MMDETGEQITKELMDKLSELVNELSEEERKLKKRVLEAAKEFEKRTGMSVGIISMVHQMNSKGKLEPSDVVILTAVLDEETGGLVRGIPVKRR